KTYNRLRRRECYAWSRLVGPNGYRPADHRGCRQRPKVPTVERILGLPVHDKDVAVGDDLASMPNWKWTPSAVALARLPHLDAIDRNRSAVSADGLSRKRQDALE